MYWVLRIWHLQIFNTLYRALTKLVIVSMSLNCKRPSGIYCNLEKSSAKYMLYPGKKPSKLHVVAPEEFNAFVQEDLDSTFLALLSRTVGIDRDSKDGTGYFRLDDLMARTSAGT